MNRTDKDESAPTTAQGRAFDGEMARLIDQLVAAIASDDVRRTKTMWRRFEGLGVEPFELELAVDRGDLEFDGHPCDWALESRSWKVLAQLLRVGLPKCEPHAEEIFGAIAIGIDQCPKSKHVAHWISTMREAVRPATLRQAHALVNDARRWQLGPVAQAAWTDEVMKFIAEHERRGLATLARPTTNVTRRGLGRL